MAGYRLRKGIRVIAFSCFRHIFLNHLLFMIGERVEFLRNSGFICVFFLCHIWFMKHLIDASEHSFKVRMVYLSTSFLGFSLCCSVQCLWNFPVGSLQQHLPCYTVIKGFFFFNKADLKSQRTFFFRLIISCVVPEARDCVLFTVNL